MKKYIYNHLSVFILVVFILFAPSVHTYAQDTTKTEITRNFGGKVTLTNKGIATVPTFTLGKPAVIFDMSMGKRLTFEPQFKFSLKGKPWAVLFWWRYELIKANRLQVKIGAHPALSFKTVTDTAYGANKNYIKTDRYIAGEIAPNWTITKHFGVGVYYLYSHGLEKEVTQNTHYVMARINLNNIRLFSQFYLSLSPQVYYLKMDNKTGYYSTGIISLVNKNFPVSISSMINKKINSEIPSDDLLWNLSLVYSFGHQYARR